MQELISRLITHLRVAAKRRNAIDNPFTYFKIGDAITTPLDKRHQTMRRIRRVYLLGPGRKTQYL